jgi:hypothetical protein
MRNEFPHADPEVRQARSLLDTIVKVSQAAARTLLTPLNAYVR